MKAWENTLGQEASSLGHWRHKKKALECLITLDYLLTVGIFNVKGKYMPIFLRVIVMTFLLHAAGSNLN